MQNAFLAGENSEAITGYNLMNFITEKELNEISNIWSIVASVVNIATILLLVLITRKNGGYKKLINYEKGKNTPKQIVIMVLLIFFSTALPLLPPKVKTPPQ